MLVQMIMQAVQMLLNKVVEAAALLMFQLFDDDEGDEDEVGEPAEGDDEVELDE